MSSLRTVGRLARGAAAFGVASAFAGVFASLFATGCASDEGLVGGSCAEGYTQCGDRCVPLAEDPDNCGACGQACLFGVACVEGVCGGEAGAPHDSAANASGDGTAADGAMNPMADGTAGGDASSEDAQNGPASDAAGTDATMTEVDGSMGGDSTVGDGATQADAATQADGATQADAATQVDGATTPEGGDATVMGVGDATLGSDAQPDGTTPSDGSAGPEGASESDAGEDGTAAGDDGSPDAETGDAASCDESLTSCGGACVDTTSDYQNCGGCGIVCASQFCQDSQCVGTTSGGLIFIGHDYDETSTGKTQSTVLSNAVFIPQTNPLRVLEYDRYAPSQAVTQIATILGAVATNLGRTLQLHTTSVDGDIPSDLSLQNYDVFLMPDQSAAPSGALAALGSPSGGNWGPALTAFATSGGVVVVLDGGTGTGEMPQFLTSTGLLNVTAQTALPARTELDDIARGDVESVGLVTAYLSSGNTVSLTTEPDGLNVVYVLVTGADASISGAPVVIHKIF